MTHPLPREQRFDPRVLLAFTSANLPATLDVKAATSSTLAEILLYDEISPFGITAKDFASALVKAGPGKVKVRINSPGGSAFDGVAIYSLLRNHPGGVDTVVDGLAASAASIVAMAGTHVAMHEQASLMIHDSHGLVIGNKHDMGEMIDRLGEMDTKMASIYAEKTGMTPEVLLGMMDAESWFSSSSAKDAGFVDEIIAPPKRAKAATEVSIQAAGKKKGGGKKCITAMADIPLDPADVMRDMSIVDCLTDAIDNINCAVDCVTADYLPPEPDDMGMDGMPAMASSNLVIEAKLHSEIEIRRRRLRLLTTTN